MRASGYHAPLAQQRASCLAGPVQQSARLDSQGSLRAKVERLLRERHSPEQIVSILRNLNPDEPTLLAGHVTIYTAGYALPCGQLRAELITCPRQARKSQRPGARGSIHDCPAEIDERIVSGHWEGDLIKVAHYAPSVARLVERTSLHVTLGKIENTTADAAVTLFGMILNRIDAQCRFSITYDQGRKMVRHEQLCETTNGLLCQYMLKGTDLAVFSQAELDDIAWQMNTCPRKSLDWTCPAELFMPELVDVRQHHHDIVALGDALRAQQASVALQP
ncbi:MAG: IS30 family transposase [Burkholderia sp.]